MTKPKNPFANPLVLFGMNRRLSKKSTIFLMMFTVCGIGGILLFSILIETISYNTDLSDLGKTSFLAVSICHAAVVIFFSAVAAAGEITGEKQRQTMDLLVCSQLTPRQIILGKMMSSFSFTLLISVVMLPVYALIYMFGGVTPLTIIAVFVMMLLCAFVASAIAVFFSTVTKKTSSAMLLTILVLLIPTAGNGILALMAEILDEVLRMQGIGGLYDTYDDLPWIIQWNPVVFIAEIYALTTGDLTLAQINANNAIEYVILNTVTPVLAFLMTFFPLKWAKNRIDPMKSHPRKA